MYLKKNIEEYLLKCKCQKNLDNKTIKAYKIDLMQFETFSRNKYDYMSKECIESFLSELQSKQYAVKTLKRKVASLKAFFSYLNDEEIVLLNPFNKIKIKLREPIVLPKTISMKNLSILFNYIEDNLEDVKIHSYRYKEIVRDRLILELLITTGIRVSELCDLRKDDIMFSMNMIKIYGKGSRERIIPIYYHTLIDSIQLYLDVFSEELIQSEYFFLNKRKKRLSAQSVRNMLKKYCVLLNINQNITPHMFRHTFATMLLDQDVDCRYIQRILGHSSILTTQIYTHVTSNKLNQIMQYKNPRSKIRSNKG